MPMMTFDLEDGKPPISFSIKDEGAVRFMAFMNECQEIINNKSAIPSLTDAERVQLVQQVVSSSDRPIGMVEYGILVSKAIEKKLRGEG